MANMEVLASALAPSGLEVFLALDQSLLDAIPTALCICSSDGAVARYNRQALEIWGKAPRAGDTHFSSGFKLYHIDGQSLAAADAPMRTAFRSGEAQRDKEVVIERPDGSRIITLVTVELFKTSAGAVQGAIACFQDITERKRVEADIREQYRHAESAQHRLGAIIESSEDAIISKNLDGIIVSWNKGAERLFGYTPKEAIGKHVTMLIPEDHQNEEPVIIDRIKRGERIEHYETLRQRKDGSLVDISLSVSPVKNAEGKIVGASKIARDITERKEAEAERGLLMAELSHRVKNTLATVISIAQQSFAKAPSPAEGLRSFDGRIRGLAQTHGRLAEGNWAGVSLETIVSDEIMPYRREDGSNVRISGPEVLMNPKCAVSLGMAFHELATNAAKYGALSDKNGIVDIAWTIEHSAERLRVQWTESGGPAVQTPKRSGFGRLLLERALASDLKGEVALEFAESGLTCTIVLPLDEFTAPSH